MSSIFVSFLISINATFFRVYLFFICSDFLEEEEIIDPEDEAEIVGTPLPKKPTRPSQSSHTSHPSQHRSKPWPTPAGRDEEEEVEVPDEEEGAVGSIPHSKGRRHFPRRDGDWGRDHTNGNTRRDVRKGLKEPHRGPPQPHMDNVVRGRSLSWLNGGPSELQNGLGRRGGEGAEAPPKMKSSLLFAQKSSLSALTSQARQILSNSAHSPKLKLNRFTENKKENQIYITRPRPAKEREKEHEREQWRERKEEKASRYPREVFPGVFLYQTGKTTKLVNLGAKGRSGGRSLVSPYQLWPNPPSREGRLPSHNGSISVQNGSTQRLVSRAAGPKQPLTSRREGEHPQSTPADLPSKTKSPASLSHHPPVTLPRSNSTANTLQDQVRVTSYLRTSEIIESQQQLDPDPNPADLEQEANRSNPDAEPEPEEGELSDYSYEEVEARPGWAEDSINWQRTFSVNPMDFELLRSDWNDLRCNVSGNLQLAESEVVDVLAQYMEKLNERNGG